MVLRLDLRLALLVFLRVRLGILDHALDVGLGKATRCLDTDLLLLAGALVLSLHIDNPVGIDVEGHLDLGYPARRRWKADEIELSEQLVVRRHLALALEHTDGYGALVVFGGGENLALFRGNSGVAIDQPREDAAQRLDAERERSDVEEQHVLDVALEDTGLNRRTHRD